MKCICIAGASGFIGRSLVQRLNREGYRLALISREDFARERITELIKGCNIIINLVGESIAGFWTKKKRRAISESRLMTTRKLVEAVNVAGTDAELFIQVSAVGIYDRYHVHTEDSEWFDDGFLGRLILKWEGVLDNIKRKGLNVVVLRLGIVLDRKGGMLRRILRLYSVGLIFGVNSEDFFPFVHLEDLSRIVSFCIEKNNLSGVMNVVAPSEIRIKDFYSKVARSGNYKVRLWLNTCFLKLLMGESSSLLTTGQHVLPKKLLDNGFTFKYDDISKALL